MKEFFKEFYKQAKGGHEYFTNIGSSEDGEYKFIHIIESDEDEYIITAKLIVPKNSKMVDKCMKDNKSPIRQMLERIEKENKRDIKEEKTESSIYNFPD